MIYRSPIGRELPGAGALSKHWRLDPRTVFLNHGSFGACSRVVLERQREMQELIEAEPVRFFVELAEGLLDQARVALAGLVNADGGAGDGLAMVANATTGVNTVLRSLRFQPGDELLTNAQEYNACNNALRFVADASGAKVVHAAMPFPLKEPGQIVDSVLAAVTRKTKLAMISHVTSPTGLVLPVAELTKRLESRGVRVLIDGAHAPGMVPLDLDAIGASYYTGNLHKWLCTPKGCAFLHVRADRRAEIRPLVISHGANSLRTDRPRFRVEFDYVGTYDISPYLCIPRAIEFLTSLDPGGITGLMATNRTAAIAGRAVLLEALGAKPAAPESMLGALASVHLPLPASGVIIPSLRGYHDQLHDRLLERHAVQAPVFAVEIAGKTPTQRVVRISMQRYNTLDQVRYLAASLIEELASER